MLVKPFQNPFSNYGGLLDTPGSRDSLELLRLRRLQVDAQRSAPSTYKDRFVRLFQLLFKVRQIVGVPELRQLFNGIDRGDSLVFSLPSPLPVSFLLFPSHWPGSHRVTFTIGKLDDDTEGVPP
jgi:hypothetical protein